MNNLESLDDITGPTPKTGCGCGCLILILLVAGITPIAAFWISLVAKIFS